MIDPRVFLRRPIDFNSICFIYPPSNNDMVDIKDIMSFFKILTYSQEEIEDIYVEKKLDLSKLPTPFSFLFDTCVELESYQERAKKAFLTFTHEPVHFLKQERKILFGKIQEELAIVSSPEKLRFLSEDNFFEFQNLIRLSFGEEKIEPPNPNEHWKIKQMKAKARYRDRIKAKQKSGGISFSTMLESICCMQIGITPLNIGEMSYAASHAILTRWQAKDKYETEIRTLQAGGDSKKIHPKYWIDNDLS